MRDRRFALLLAACALLATASVQAFQQPEGATGFTAKLLVTAKRQMVVAGHPLAAEAGRAMLRKGGSAIDAAIAAQMVLNLVEPQSSGIGGGAFLLYWDRASKTLASIDGREAAPSVATPELFLDAAGNPWPMTDAMESGLSVGVPGLLAALALAHKKYGSLRWATLFKPAIKLANDGFPVSPRLAKLLADVDPEGFAPEARAYFFDENDRPWPEGTVLTNIALASTFAAIAHDGPRAFYDGDLARDIATVVQGDPRGPGLLTAKDIPEYRAKERQAVCVAYRAYEVCGAGPPSSGGVTVGQVLALIEPFDLGSSPLSVSAAHVIAEAERLAFADRARYLADTDFVAVPLPGLLDQKYLDKRRALINPDRALGDVTAGSPPNTRQGAFGRDGSHESIGTTHISIVDKKGNAVAMTSSIEQAFGSRLMVHGFLLNNELTDFAFAPVDEEGRAVANHVEPGKRPRSSMDPTLIFADGRKLAYVLGSPGGPAIIPFVAKAIVGLIDWGLDPQEAADLTNFGSFGGVFLLEPDPKWDKLEVEMDALGHDVRRVALPSGLNIVAVTPDGLEGGADPRRDGVSLGD